VSVMKNIKFLAEKGLNSYRLEFKDAILN